VTTLSTAFGKVRTGSHRRFIAVAKHGAERPVIHARSDSRSTLETRLRREGFSVEKATGLFVIHERATIIDGVPTPGKLLAAVEIVERNS
jgi:hypothetical protein